VKLRYGLFGWLAWKLGRRFVQRRLRLNRR
jgi:hypothetical protein